MPNRSSRGSTNAALNRPHVAEMRRRVCACLAGEVVEIGFGSRLNVAPYLPSVTSRASPSLARARSSTVPTSSLSGPMIWWSSSRSSVSSWVAHAAAYR